MSSVDPVLRCDSCQALVKVTTLHKLGSCNKCGNRRMRSLTVLSEKERNKLAAWGFHDLLKEFEAKDDADDD